ncbi:hypothetical protein BGY98DRAFT_951671, partial [Russula aff. rugulosa BPL654]
MRSFVFYSLFLVPFTTVLAQNNNNNASSAASAQVTVFTSFSTGISLDQNRQTATFLTAIPVTLTLTANSPNATGNSTNSNSTSSNSNSTSTNSTSTGPLPTAPTDVNGGGNGPNGAPSPGQTGTGGVYGPPDGYVSGVSSLQWNAMVVGIAGAIMVLSSPYF